MKLDGLISYLLSLTLGSQNPFYESEGLSRINDRPIIGVLSQDISHRIQDNYPNKTKTIAASYVKFIESAGARVVPILINQTEEYYDFMYQSINGLILPGGDVSLNDSGYAKAGNAMYERAVIGNTNGDFFPIWGTCLGFELLILMANQNRANLRHCYAENVALPLKFSSEFYNSRLGNSMPPDVRNILQIQNVTANFHTMCLTPENFTYFDMGMFWSELSTSTDSEDVEFISLVEAKNFPFWGSQFHPEKNAFEWKQTFPDDDFHSPSAIFANNWFANFFVNQARKSNHTFPDRKSEEKYLIYNYNPTFTGNLDVNYIFQQMYLFE